MDLHDGSGQAARQVRAAVLSAVVVVVSLHAHLSAGGDSPPMVGLVAGWGVLAVMLSALTRHQLRLPLVLGLLTGGQLLVHLALSEVAAATSPTVAAAATRMTTSSGTHVHHHHAGVAELSSPAAVVPPADTLASMPDVGWTMLAAHLLAAVAIGVWLVAGERVAWQLGQVVTAVVLQSVAGLALLFAGVFAWACPVRVGPPATARRVWFVAAEARQLALASAGSAGTGLLTPVPSSTTSPKGPTHEHPP